MPNLIEIKNIHHSMNANFSIDLDQLFFQDGPVYALTGESGSGKSMLLKILALIEPVQEGSVTIFDEKVTGRKSRLRLRRRLGYLSQEPYLFSGTVADNIAMGLEFRGKSGEEIEVRVNKLLSEFNLTPYTNTPIDAIPGSIRQMTAIARTLAPHPEILLMDEPMLHVDHNQYKMLINYLTELNTERGVTIILSTKSTNVVAKLANISINLRYGKIIRIRTGAHQTKAGEGAGLRRS